MNFRGLAMRIPHSVFIYVGVGIFVGLVIAAILGLLGIGFTTQ